MGRIPGNSVCDQDAEGAATSARSAVILLSPRGLVACHWTRRIRKSTTQAAMIDYINRGRRVCYLPVRGRSRLGTYHRPTSAHQRRELETDTMAFPNAGRAALPRKIRCYSHREMRDLGAIRISDNSHLRNRPVFVWTRGWRFGLLTSRDVFPASTATGADADGS